MRHAAAFLALALLASSAAAQNWVYDQPMTPGGGTLRPSQLWIDPAGQNDSDNDAIAWENFQLAQDTLVTRVRWWGELAPTLGFEISFFYQDPGTIAVQPDIFAPGSGPISSEIHSNFTQTWVSGSLYQFEVDLASPLLFEANTRYFVSVVGRQPLSYVYWQWAASSSGTYGTFWWQRGLHMYFQLGENRAVSLAGLASPAFGTSFCSGDGTAGPCPCGNSTSAGRGCRNSTGKGAHLSVLGSASVAADDLRLATNGLPANESCLTFMSAATIFGLPFGDGRRCVSGQITRLPLVNSGPAGNACYAPGLAAWTLANAPLANQILPGRTLGFQTWYRDPAGPCTSGTNLSNGQQVAFLP